MPSNKEFLALPVPKPQHITLIADWQLSWLLSPLRRNVPILNHLPLILIFLSLPPQHKRSRQQLQFSCSACAGCGHEISTQVNRFSQKTQQHFQSISQTHTTISHCAFVLLPPRKMILSISPHGHKKKEGERKKAPVTDFIWLHEVVPTNFSCHFALAVNLLSTLANYLYQ